MSLINKMLQDLDRRNAMAEGSVAPQPVRPVASASRRGEWFWRIVSALMLGALGWVGWVAWHVLLPRPPLATPAAYVAEKQAQARAKEPKVVKAEPVAEPQPQPVKAEPQLPVETMVPVETMRLAKSIETPITGPLAKPEKPKKAVAVAQAPQAPQPKVEKSKIERRELVAPPNDRAEAEFRAAVELLRQGRTSQAEAGFLGALQLDPAHRGARQALVALQLERGQLESARRLLEEGLKIDPAQPDFSVALARILVERRDFPGALAALQASEAAAGMHAEHQFLRGTVLQRLGRHQEAADAYRDSLRLQEASVRSWIGLGISLEALQHKAEAAEAFKRGLALGPSDAELKSFAEQRVRALR
jgi:MSHA biogenesis protein MshN